MPRRLVAATLAALALGVASCGGPKEPRAVPTTRPPGPTATPFEVSSWTRASAPALAIGGGPATTIGGTKAPSQPGAPWVVVGTRSTPAGVPMATVWTSTDGVAWSATALSAPGVASEARAVTGFGDRTVVVGSVGSGSSRRAAAWLSPAPGAPFSPVADQAAFGASNSEGGSSGAPGGGAEMNVVAAGALGLFAAGTVAGEQALWYSTDGRHFSRVQGAEHLLDGTSGATVNAILVTPEGVLAAGSRRDSTRTDGAIWTSTDGISWKQQPDPQKAFSGGDDVITGLATINRSPGTTFVAVGSVDDNGRSSPASWISPDGASWSMPSLSFPLDGTVPGSARAGGSAEAVASGPSGLVAVGAGGGAARVWTSADGRSWAPLGLPAAATGAAWNAGRVATDGNAVVVADPTPGQARLLSYSGGAWHELSADASTWGTPRTLAVPTALVSDGRTLRLFVKVTDPGQVLGAQSTTTVVLDSPDGSTWKVEASGPVFAGGSVGAAAASTSGRFAAVGAKVGGPGSPPAGQAWSSPDGSAWVPAQPAGGAFGPADPTRLTGVAPLGSGGMVAVGMTPAAGSGPAVPVAWTSPDGLHWSSPAALDHPPGLGGTDVRGLCTSGAGLVAVGDEAGTPGRRGLGWISSDGAHWRRVAFPAPPDGGTETVQGCAASGTGPAGVLAWGAATASDGSTVPALWQSQNGRTWTGSDPSAFGSAAPQPLADVAVDGRHLLAVGGGPVAADDTSPGAGLGLWRSDDGGATWTRADTTASAWQAATEARLDRVAWVGSTAVVAGSVDGELAVWTSAAG